MMNSDQLKLRMIHIREANKKKKEELALNGRPQKSDMSRYLEYKFDFDRGILNPAKIPEMKALEEQLKKEGVI